MRRRLFSLVLVTGLVTALGCSNRSDANTVTVFAAASLTDAFQAIADEFRETHPDVAIELQFAGSQSLRTQIEQGAAPHVFASANHQHMEALVGAKLATDSATFAKNRMVIAVPKSNPAGLESFADLPKAKRLVLAGKTVPAGAYADAIIDAARASHGPAFSDAVRRNVVSRELHVRQTLQKVAMGEADAAMVYATDAAVVGDEIRVIPIPATLNQIAAYPIAVVKDSELARRFVNFVQSPRGATILRDHGFAVGDELAAR